MLIKKRLVNQYFGLLIAPTLKYKIVNK